MVDVTVSEGTAVGEPVRVARRARGTGHVALRRALGAWLLLLPSLVLLALFVYAPIVQLAWDSLHAKPVAGARTVFAGLDNFAAVLADPAFRKALLNNLIYAVATVVPSLTLALFFAIALTRSGRFNALLRSVFFLPVLIPLIAAASLFLFIFLPGVGLIDYYLGKYGRFIVSNPPNWLGDPDIALWSLIVLTVWKNAGYYMLFFLAGLQAVPADAYEAAYLEGASPFQRLWYVTLPYLRPTIAFVFVIALINIVTQVDHVFVLTKGGPSDSTNLVLFYIYQQAVENYDVGRASAATLISLAFLLAVTLLSLGSLERSLGGRGR